MWLSGIDSRLLRSIFFPASSVSERACSTAIEPKQFAALVAVVRDGGKVVSTTAFLTTPSDEARGVTATTVFVRPNRERLTELVSLVDDGSLTVEVTRRIPLVELPTLHVEATEGRITGKVVVLAR